MAVFKAVVSTFLFLIELPFIVTFRLRTVSEHRGRSQNIFSDRSTIFSLLLRNAVGLSSPKMIEDFKNAAKSLKVSLIAVNLRELERICFFRIRKLRSL